METIALPLATPASSAFHRAQVGAGPGAPRLMIAARVLGASGQPWLTRQATGLHGFRTALVCWERRMVATGDPLSAHRVHRLGQPAAPFDDGRRWAYRLRNLVGGNFYAECGGGVAELRRLLREERPDVLLCYFGDVAMRLLPVARSLGIPVIAYLHGDFLFRTNRWYRWSLLRCAPRFASVVSVTEAERDWLVAHGVPPDRAHVIPCGAPTDVFRPSAHAQEGPLRFVMCSRLVAEKGCDVTIQAYARMADAVPSGRAQLHIYGDGPDRPAFESLVGRLAVRDSVYFHGYVGEQRLAAELPRCDVFVQHSLGKEGSPVSMAEAMACALPVVSTAVGGIAAQITHGVHGLLVAEHDVDAMADAMRRLANDAPLRRTLGRAGRQRATQEYNAAAQTARLGDVIHRTLEAVA